MCITTAAPVQQSLNGHTQRSERSNVNFCLKNNRILDVNFLLKNQNFILKHTVVFVVVTLGDRSGVVPSRNGWALVLAGRVDPIVW